MGPHHEVKCAPSPRGPGKGTRHRLVAFDSTDCHGCQPRVPQMSLLSGLFSFTGGGERCAYPPPTPSPRFADFITLAFPGETQIPLLLRMWPRIRVGGCARTGPNSQRPLFCDPLLTFLQHYNTKHRFKCSDCDEEFTAEGARNQVRPFL